MVARGSWRISHLRFGYGAKLFDRSALCSAEQAGPDTATFCQYASMPGMCPAPTTATTLRGQGVPPAPATEVF